MQNLASNFGLKFKCRGSDNVWARRYAFGVVLGEMIMRSKPYLAQRREGKSGQKKKRGSIAYMIARDGLRPDIFPTTPLDEDATEWEMEEPDMVWLASALSVMAKACWCPDPTQRPTFRIIVKALNRLTRRLTNCRTCVF